MVNSIFELTGASQVEEGSSRYSLHKLCKSTIYYQRQ